MVKEHTLQLMEKVCRGMEEWERNGQGTYTWSDGRKYVGEFKDGIKHGQGTYTWSDGRKYDRGMEEWEINGQGTFTYPDGEKYVGEWKDGKEMVKEHILFLMEESM